MSSQKKRESNSPEKVSDENAGQDELQREMALHMEYDALTENLKTLQGRAEQLRKENDFLHYEIAQTCEDNKEYISYLNKTAEDKNIALKRLSAESQQELEMLRRRRQNLQDKHQEQTSELQEEILQMEKQLAKLNIKIEDLKDVKTLQQQQASRIAELERELMAMQCRHSESLVALKADFVRDKKSCEQQTEDKVKAYAISANKKAHQSLMSYINEVFEENQSLQEEILNLLPRVKSLRRQAALLADQRQLLLQRECVQKRYAQRVSQHSNNSTTETGVNK